MTPRKNLSASENDNKPSTILGEYEQHLKNNGVHRLPDFGKGFQKYVSEHSGEFSELLKKN